MPGECFKKNGIPALYLHAIMQLFIIFIFDKVKNKLQGFEKLSKKERIDLKKGDSLMAVKSTTIAISFTPVDIWKEKFESRGLFEAIENIKKLYEY